MALLLSGTSRPSPPHRQRSSPQQKAQGHSQEPVLPLLPLAPPHDDPLPLQRQRCKSYLKQIISSSHSLAYYFLFFGLLPLNATLLHIQPELHILGVSSIFLVVA